MVSNRRLYCFIDFIRLLKSIAWAKKEKHKNQKPIIRSRGTFQCDVFLLIIPQKLDRQTAFHMACEQGAMSIVQYLVGKDPAVCRITLVDCKGKTPLHMAAKRNHAHVVSFLLEKVSPAAVLSNFLLGDEM